MAEITLAVQTGRPKGSRPSNRLRAQGMIPGVVYGQGIDPVPVSVGWHELRAALTTDAGLNALLDLQMDGDTKLAIVKDIQRHPVRHTVHHVDFVLVDRNQELSVDVPIVTTGDAVEVTRENGLVDQVLFHLTVSARPDRIPNELEVDISGLTLGDSIRVADVALPEGVTTDVDPEEPVVVTAVTRAEAAEASQEGEGDEEATDAGAETTDADKGDSEES